MTYGMDPEELDRAHRSNLTPRSIVGRFVLVVLLLAVFVGIVVVMAL